MNKKVSFFPRDMIVSQVVQSPKPSRDYMPDWFKNLGAAWKDPQGFLRAGPTKCMPLLDSFTSGYIHELAVDVEVINAGKDPRTGKDLIRYRWGDIPGSKIQPIITRQHENGAPPSLPHFPGYYDIEFQWYTLWDAETPKGYSTIYHHPNNRFDLPFQTFSGIIDTDSWHGSGPVPFLLKEGFTGVIPAGTPIIQFTFVKRENWVSKKEDFNMDKKIKHESSVKKYFQGGYKKEHWVKKEFK
jgi:hypothetical protein